MVGKKMVYAPDGFFVLSPARVERRAGKEGTSLLASASNARATTGGAFLLEYQLSPLSSERWAAKWAVAAAFFDGGAYKSASWQPAGNVKVKPRIVAITKQGKETVGAGSSLSLVIEPSIDFLL